MMLAWPIYFTLALFAPVLLRAFGHHYSGGASALAILALAMLVATGIGPVDIVLLMGGRSTWNLFNVIVALILNIVIGWILIPRIGIAGAAVASPVDPLQQHRTAARGAGVPEGRSVRPRVPRRGLSAALCFGGIGMLFRLTLGQTIPSLLVYAVLATTVYAGMLYAFRDRLELPLMWETVSRRRVRSKA